MLIYIYICIYVYIYIYYGSVKYVYKTLEYKRYLNYFNT
jgi:hypothetical protein